MTPRQRVMTVLRGGHAEKVPFTMYECMIPQSSDEREMRNRGLCIVNRRTPAFITHRPNVRTTQEIYWEADRRFTKTVYETPAGTLSTLSESADFTHWRHEKMFKGPEDYKAMLSFIQDEQYEQNYEAFAAAEEAFGGDGIARVGIALEPLQALISGDFMDMQDFCVEWMDRRDEVLRLYHALVENRRRMYALVAGSPASHANYGGNVVAEVIGPENFVRYYLPHYNEAAEVLHRAGKLIGCHFDGNCKVLAEAIARTELDYIEAFTPAPDTDMTLAEARAAWAEKVLWINFPSSVHLKPGAEVEAATVDLIDQAGRPDGLIIGITEDMPPDRWQGSCRAIMDGIGRHARDNPAVYSRPCAGV